MTNYVLLLETRIFKTKTDRFWNSRIPVRFFSLSSSFIHRHGFGTLYLYSYSLYTVFMIVTNKDGYYF